MLVEFTAMSRCNYVRNCWLFNIFSMLERNCHIPTIEMLTQMLVSFTGMEKTLLLVFSCARCLDQPAAARWWLKSPRSSPFLWMFFSLWLLFLDKTIARFRKTLVPSRSSFLYKSIQLGFPSAFLSLSSLPTSVSYHEPILSPCCRPVPSSLSPSLLQSTHPSAPPSIPLLFYVLQYIVT